MTEIRISTDERGDLCGLAHRTVHFLRSVLRPGVELEDAVADYGQLLPKTPIEHKVDAFCAAVRTIAALKEDEV